ncbi:uncharacterized protein LOC121431208 [Lytechinus variegatus]|uniref:uncharacterized protein LOC121431208 n=1 Tax=Lytechinus variegatus TaxID=7654 RepID=UPI001BB0E94E|nr:uncharacterized protein LOC121431208 [Lytechinus variegatus]
MEIMTCQRIFLVSIMVSSLRLGLTQENKVLAECTFDDSENCGFQIIPDLDGVHHRELWTLSSGGTLGRNCPPSDHTPGINQDVFANSKSLESTLIRDFQNFTTKIISPEMNFTSGMGQISLYYFLWIADDPEGNEDTFPSLNVIGCNGELMWTRMGITGVWSFVDIRFHCPTPGKIMFEASHHRPGSGVAIDDVKIVEIPFNPGVVDTTTPEVPTTEMAPGPQTTRGALPVTHSQTTVALGIMSSGNGDRIIIIAVGCFLGALLIFAVSITIHCYFWRKRKRANQRHLTDATNGLHVSNTGYDFLTGIAGVNNGNGSSKSGATETSNLSTISKGFGGPSYQMDVVSEKFKGNGTFEKREEDCKVPPKGKKRSIGIVSFKRSRGSKDRSFEYSEIPDSTSPTDENLYQFLTTPRKQIDGKTPKLGEIGRSAKINDNSRIAKMKRSNSLPSRQSIESTKMEGPYHVTDLIGNITIDNAMFPSMETVAYDDLKRKESVKYDQPILIPSIHTLPKSTDHEYRALEPRKRSNSYDVLRINTPSLISLSDESIGDNSHVYKELEKKDDQDDYDLLDPITVTEPAPRDLADYENPPPRPPVLPKPTSPFGPRPMSPRLKQKTEPFPSDVTPEGESRSVEGPDGANVVRDPKYYTLVPDLVRDASYDYPDMVVGDGTDDPDKESDIDSNIYESFDRPVTPNGKGQRSTPNSRQGSKETPYLDNAAKDRKTLIKQKQLERFLDDDYENLE